MAAWGHTSEHWLHWMHLPGSQTGTSTAAPRFSYLLVPAGQVPSSMPYFTTVDTGMPSPSWRFITSTTSWMKAGALFSAGTSWALAQLSGMATSWSSLRPWSIEALFMSTTAWPFFL